MKHTILISNDLVPSETAWICFKTRIKRISRKLKMVKIFLFSLFCYTSKFVLKLAQDEDYHVASIKNTENDYLRLVKSKRIDGVEANDEFAFSKKGEFLKIKQQTRSLCVSDGRNLVRMCGDKVGNQKITIVPKYGGVKIVLDEKCLTKSSEYKETEDLTLILKQCVELDNSQLFTLHKVTKEGSSKDHEDSSSVCVTDFLYIDQPKKELFVEVEEAEKNIDEINKFTLHNSANCNDIEKGDDIQSNPEASQNEAKSNKQKTHSKGTATPKANEQVETKPSQNESRKMK